MGDYLNLEDPEEEISDAKHSTQVEVTTQAYETEDVEVIETHEVLVEDVPLPVAPMDKPDTEMSLVESPVSKVILPLKLL